MLQNYFKMALRHLSKQKMYSAIKIGGFAFGITACLLIGLYVRYETSYDRFYPNADRIYRVIGQMNDNGTIKKNTSFPAPMSKVLQADFPDVEKAGRLKPNSLKGTASNYIRRADQVQNTYESGFAYADPELLDILDISMIYGDKTHALAEPNTIVISKLKADKYFPNENPVGKTVYLDDDKNNPYRIGGVMKDFPSNSHLQYDFLLTLKGAEFFKGEQTTWEASNYDVYVLLHPGTNISQFEKKVTSGVLNNYVIPALKKSGNVNADQLLEAASLHLQPVSDIHLRSYDIDDSYSNGDIRFMWLFSAIACFILVLACINFINLSTAKSANRAKEVGLRKVAGSYRSGLVKQFLTESFLFTFLSFALAILLAIVLLPYFNTLSAKSLTIPWNEWWLLPVLLAAVIVIGILAGLYPSFYLSSFNPISVLKGQVSKGSKNSMLRNILVVFQFATSIILIVGTIVIYNQMQFIQHKKLGFDKDQVLLIEGTNTLGTGMQHFKNQLLKLPQVKHVSVGDYLPVNGTKRNGNEFWKEGKTREESGIFSQMWQVDNEYIHTMGMKIAEGRNFYADLRNDSQSAIINQSLAKKLQLKNPIGRNITNGYSVYRVIGVVEDFHFESMRSNIGPLCMVVGNSPSMMSVKINTGDMKSLIASVTAIWGKSAPGQPLRYTFLDESFANMYADVQRTGRIFTSFAVLAIIIACMGLFALSAFMAEQRNKEIGIRKVLGASIVGVTAMLSKDFVKLVVIAIVIASPIAWWSMNKWLQDFAYRTDISWQVFVFAGILSLLIAIITVCFQSIKAAIANPVKSLRSE